MLQNSNAMARGAAEHAPGTYIQEEVQQFNTYIARLRNVSEAKVSEAFQ